MSYRNLAGLIAENARVSPASVLFGLGFAGGGGTLLFLAVTFVDITGSRLLQRLGIGLGGLALLGIGLASLWSAIHHARQIDALDERPPEDIVAVNLERIRGRNGYTDRLVLSDRQGRRIRLFIGGFAGVAWSSEESDNLLREAALRWPAARIGGSAPAALRHVGGRGTGSRA